MQENTSQQIVNQFTRILSGKNKEIKDAEAVLGFLHDKNDFFTALLSIPLMSQVTGPVAKMASVYTATFCRHLAAKQNQAEINSTANKILEFLSSANIQFGYREQVAAALEYLLRVDSKCIILSIMQPNLVELLQKAVQAEDISHINFEFLALYARILADFGINPANTLYPFIEKVLVPMAILTYKVVEEGGKLVNQNKAQAEKAFQLGSIFSETIIKYIKKFLFLKSPITKLLFEPVFPQLVNLLLNLNLPNNTLDTTVFYYNQKHEFQKIVVLAHTLKSNAITILTQSTRLLHHSKDFDSSSCQLIVQAPEFIREFIRSMASLLEKTQYYKLRAVSQVRVCEEIYLYLLASLRLGNHFSLFSELKNSLIFSCIFKMLAFTPEDYDRYYHEPDEFVNSVIQTIDMNPSALLKRQKQDILTKQRQLSAKVQGEEPEQPEEDEDIEEDYSNLKSLAANLLSQIVKYLDGALTEVIFYCVGVIDDRINIELSKNLMLLVLCILRDDVKNREDLKASVGKVLLNQLRDLGLPKKSQQEPYSTNDKYIDIEYSLVLLAMSRYCLLIYDGFHNFFDKLFLYVEMLMADQKIEETPKLIACEVITTFMAVEEGSQFAQKLLRLFNRLLNSTTVNRRYLECIQLLIKEQDFQFKDDCLEVGVLAERVCALLKWQLQLSTGSSPQDQHHIPIIYQLWNIIKELCSCQYIMPTLSSKIEDTLRPLITLIDGSNELLLDDHIFEITSLLLQRKVYTTEFELNVIDAVPKGFYTGKKKYSLSSSFEMLQLAIFYGKDILLQNMNVVKTLALLCIDSINTKTANEKPRPEADQCEGVLILQSLIISCCDGQSSQNQVMGGLDGELWNMLAKNITQKIISSTIFYDFYKTSLLNLLSLILAYGHRHFSENDNLNIILLLLQNCQCFEQYPNSHLFVICLSDMLMCYNYPFVSNNYILLMDMLITILKIKSMNKDSVLEKRELDDEQRHFQKLKSKSPTILDKLDEFEYFRDKVHRLRISCNQALDDVYNGLAEVKKAYLKDILHVRKIGNEARPIFKIKSMK